MEGHHEFDSFSINVYMTSNPIEIKLPYQAASGTWGMYVEKGEFIGMVSNIQSGLAANFEEAYAFMGILSPYLELRSDIVQNTFDKNGSPVSTLAHFTLKPPFVFHNSNEPDFLHSYPNLVPTFRYDYTNDSNFDMVIINGRQSIPLSFVDPLSQRALIFQQLAGPIAIPNQEFQGRNAFLVGEIFARECEITAPIIKLKFIRIK